VDLQEALLEEIQSGINMVQAQDTQIVEEANSIFGHYRDAVEAMSKIIADNASQILTLIGMNIAMQ
jgi:hypothetical protein